MAVVGLSDSFLLILLAITFSFVIPLKIESGKSQHIHIMDPKREFEVSFSFLFFVVASSGTIGLRNIGLRNKNGKMVKMVSFHTSTTQIPIVLQHMCVFLCMTSKPLYSLILRIVIEIY